MSKRYGGDGEEYVALDKEEDGDFEAQRKLDESESFVHMGKGMRSLDLER